MPDRGRNAEGGADERCRQLRAQLFLSICHGTEDTALIPIESRGAADPMTKLVKRRPAPVHRVEDAIRPWHLHILARRRIECRGTADAEGGAGRRTQRFCLRKDKPFRRTEEHTSALQSLMR